MSRTRGFALIELVVALVIILLLALLSWKTGSEMATAAKNVGASRQCPSVTITP
jgi:prepilin-type N-terminal cleavage/methylation domain-containing protein